MLDSLHEWQFHLAEEPSLSLGSSENDRRKHNEPTWLWEDGKIPEGLETTVSNTAIAARSLLKHVIGLNDALSAARREKEQDGALIDRLTSEFGLFIARIEQISAVWDLLSTVPIEGEEPLAKWITRRADDKNDYIFNASPISSASHLANSLWRRAAGAVLTSATLQSLGSFNLILRQTGLLWLPETTTLALESPFNFDTQGELYIPPVHASPKDPDAHTAAIVEWLPKLVSPVEAIGTLVLFSSRKQMQDVALRLPDEYLPLLLVQGELPKAVLLQRHHQAIAEGKASIIFGLDSFAEGLDLPGTACVQVIIAKLPFAMPDNPIEKTQNRWIEQRGGNPFIEITVPEASIKLIQAVGRLIRTEQDYGRVTILDNRVKTQRYGQQLLAFHDGYGFPVVPSLRDFFPAELFIYGLNIRRIEKQMRQIQFACFIQAKRNQLPAYAQTAKLRQNEHIAQPIFVFRKTRHIKPLQCCRTHQPPFVIHSRKRQRQIIPIEALRVIRTDFIQRRPWRKIVPFLKQCEG